MPPPSSENDLKRRARRRLIGAVALTLLAVIVLPLLLEDEPPPASSLAVKMAVSPAAALRDEPNPSAEAEPAEHAAVAAAPSLPQPEARQPAPPQAAPAAAAPGPEPLKPAVARPAPQPEPSRPAPQQAVAKPAPTPAPQAKPAATGETFVVQLAALSDSAKAGALKARAASAGLPAYTDKVGVLTRVRVGPYASREAAVAAAVKLAENGMAGQVLAK